MADWDELRLMLAIHRSGTLAGAAATLRIDHSTIFRRLNAIEQRRGARLFERLPGGSYQATTAGQRMIIAAERMEDEANAMERDIAGLDHKLSGRLRITSSETLAFSLLVPHLASFQKQHPGILVELVIDNRVLSLTRREADIALRPIRPREEGLWGKKLANVAWSLYASPAYMETIGGPVSEARLSELDHIIGWEEGASGINAAEWLSDNVQQKAFIYRTNSIINQFVAAKANIGLALLPCYLADSVPGLVRALNNPIRELEGELWIITHSDLKTTARVRAFFDVVGAALSAQRNLFEGS